MADELWGGNVSASLWAPPASFSVGYPRNGELLTDTHPTHIGGWWFQSLIDEIQCHCRGRIGF